MSGEFMFAAGGLDIIHGIVGGSIKAITDLAQATNGIEGITTSLAAVGESVSKGLGSVANGINLGVSTASDIVQTNTALPSNGSSPALGTA